MPYADPGRQREFQREYQRAWNESDPERRREISQKSDRKRRTTEKRQRQIAEVRRRQHIRHRVAVIRRYGGQCAFCGSGQFEHLTVDHINGDGALHRATEGRRYRSIYDLLYHTAYEPGLYRLLCWNCHMAMTRYGVMPGGEPLHDTAWWETYGALRQG